MRYDKNDQTETVHTVETWVFVTLSLLVLINVTYMIYAFVVIRQEKKRLKMIEANKTEWLKAQEAYLEKKKIEDAEKAEKAEEERKKAESPLSVVKEESSEESSCNSGSSSGSSIHSIESAGAREIPNDNG